MTSRTNLPAGCGLPQCLHRARVLRRRRRLVPFKAGLLHQTRLLGRYLFVVLGFRLVYKAFGARKSFPLSRSRLGSRHHEPLGAASGSQEVHGQEASD
uniref:Uncharacterized protein n=1 Tax=Zea mays TaxID=4577 RepID=A0A804LLP2_MAIZE